MYLCKVKILIVRFSSIGDIVLTSPVVRALKEQLQDAEIHYLTKEAFSEIPEANVHISKVYTITKSIDEVVHQLKKETYDWVIDLHNNIRTKGLKTKLRRPSKTFKKLNLEKWLLVKTKVNKLPKVHVVDRYFETVRHLGILSDGKSGDFFIEPKNEIDLDMFGLTAKGYVAVAIGAQHETKCLPVTKLVAIIEELDFPVALIGGPSDQEKAQKILSLVSSKVVDTCGKLNLQQSASLVKQSARLITHDTGMMHIASCFDLPMTTVWGNTVPDFGMYPYLPNQSHLFTVHQVEGLKCRPCSKIGHNSCPKKHFDCMMKQNISDIVNPSEN